MAQKNKPKPKYDKHLLFPVGRQLGEILTPKNYATRINFSLWYNKFVPITKWELLNEYELESWQIEKANKSIEKAYLKLCDKKGKIEDPKDYYREIFNGYFNLIKNEIKRKHDDQILFANSCSSVYSLMEIKATTISPLVVGMGEMHPSETSMLFDRNLGIPYIPASSIKGVVRFAKTLEMVMDLIEKGKVYTKEKGKEFVNLEKSSDFKTLIDIFGGDRDKKKWRGRVIFLDAYPENEVELDLDIMNPHYGDYYSKKRINEQNNRIQPPSDNLTPNPIKFLVVKPQTTFIFRALIPKECESLTGEVKKIFEKALEKEGIGAKTSLGYGRFKVENVSIN